MAKLQSIEKLLNEFRARRPIRSGSLIITVFGDSISQHGGSVWLGSLIKAMESFGLNARLVRTAVYRLIQEEWLTSTQVGRRSYYSFTEFGQHQYQKAARRIYVTTRDTWDGQWTLVMSVNNLDENRDEVIKELRWLGFGLITPGVMARPGIDRKSLDELLQELEITDQVAVMQAATEEVASTQVLKELADRCWELDVLEERYQEFLDRFRPALASLLRAKNLDPEQCFQLRTLMIHEYRRILLKDTELPDELLPVDWAGRSAANLAANIYRATHALAESYLMENMETAEGRLPRASASYYQRFEGLPSN